MPDDVYTHGHADAVLRSHRVRSIADSAAYLEPHLRAGASLLDVGCGPGSITAEFGSRLAPGAVVGIDRSAEVIAEASERCAGDDNVEILVGDVYALEFDDDTFDIVHAHQVLQHLSDPVAALREMRRVCRPDGVVACRDADYSSFGWAPADPVLDAWLAGYREVARGNDAEPDAGRYLKQWAVEAGFSEVTATASIWCFSTESALTWWSELWAARVTTTVLHDQLVERDIASDDECAEMAAAFRRWAAADGAVFTVPQGEILARP